MEFQNLHPKIPPFTASSKKIYASLFPIYITFIDVKFTQNVYFQGENKHSRLIIAEI
jgi:hypothetical protein